MKGSTFRLFGLNFHRGLFIELTGTVIFAICVILLLNQIGPDWFKTLLVIIGFIGLVAMGRILRKLSRPLLEGSLGVFLVIFAIYWWRGGSFLGKEITDNAFLAVTTTMYVILTYLLLRYTRKSFDIARYPLLDVKKSDDLYYIIMNTDKENYAESVKVFVDVMEKPKNLLGRFLSIFRPRLVLTGITSIYEFEEIRPKDQKEIDVFNDFKGKYKIWKKTNNYDEFDGYYTTYKEDLILKVDFTIEYESDTGFSKEGGREKSFEIEIKRKLPN